MKSDAFEALLALQDGVISRRQALAHEFGPNDIRRLLRRRDWALAEPGVYVNHTGPMTWTQRAWVAVLVCEPAALCHESALRALDGPGRRGHDDRGAVHIAIDRTRSIKPPQAWIVVHRLADLDKKVQWNATPPRVRVEDAVLDVAARAKSDYETIAVLADAVQARRTTAGRLHHALAARTRIRRRALIAGVLDDIAAGTCSVLEHGYLNRVERPHGLPRARRQSRAVSRKSVYRDVIYEEQGLVVELDGLAFHNNARARDRDLDRDLDAALDGLDSVRMGWGQVFDRSCRTAVRIGTLLQRRGWTGQVSRCPRCPGS